MKRIGGAIFNREEYERQMLDTLEKVQSKSQRLIHQAENSGLWIMSEGMRQILKG